MTQAPRSPRSFSLRPPRFKLSSVPVPTTCHPERSCRPQSGRQRSRRIPTKLTPHNSVKAFSTGDGYKLTRARLNITSAVNVPTKAGTGRMNTRRTPHTNCRLKQGDPCGGWPHSNDTTKQTISRKCGESSNTPTIRLPALIFRHARQAAYTIPPNARIIAPSTSKIERMHALYEALLVPASPATDRWPILPRSLRFQPKPRKYQRAPRPTYPLLVILSEAKDLCTWNYH